MNKPIKAIESETIKGLEFGQAMAYQAVDSAQLSSGILEVEANGIAGYDGGHKDADEIFFVLDGKAQIRFPSEDQLVEIKKGDFLLIPQNMPHIAENRTGYKVRILWVTVKNGEESASI